MVATGMCLNLGFVVTSCMGTGRDPTDFCFLRALLLDRSIVCGRSEEPGSQLAFHPGSLPGCFAFEFLDV